MDHMTRLRALTAGRRAVWGSLLSRRPQGPPARSIRAWATRSAWSRRSTARGNSKRAHRVAACSRRTYHAGSVMTGGVTVHTIFWAPAGYGFQGSPGFGSRRYEGMIQQFFTDVAADCGRPRASTCTNSTAECNVFSTLPQYGQGTSAGNVAPGDYSIRFSSSNPNDVIHDTDPYPATALRLAAGRDRLHHRRDRSAGGRPDREQPRQRPRADNLWYVFLPPDVDECISPDVCGTNAFGGYHSLLNVNGHGVTIYAVDDRPDHRDRRPARRRRPQGQPRRRGGGRHRRRTRPTRR